VQEHLLDLARHTLDMRDDELVEVRVLVRPDLERATKLEFVRLVHLEHICAHGISHVVLD
jgi:DNA-binding Xre family transcriptional regulator